MSLPVFSLKQYQIQTLGALRKFLEKTVEFKDADTAFYALTKRPFVQPPSLPGLPYVCLRIPTGGGKTILAAHSISVAADSFLRTDAPTVLWLVPSQTIREQTPEEFKAWSQNIGHERVLTTFNAYGNVAAHRQAEIILGLGNTEGAPRAVSNDATIAALEVMLAQLKGRP